MTRPDLMAEPSVSTRLRWLLSDSMVIARRSLAHVRQIPEKLIDVTLQPLMFVLLFAFVFGGVIAVPGGDYREYLIGGILVQTIAFGMVGPATALATDLSEGIVDRFRTLPMSRSSFLLGHMIAALAAMTLAIATLTISGLIVGWQIHASPPQAVAGYGLLLAFAFTMLWVGALDRCDRALARRGDGNRVPDRLPAHLPGEHLRADRRAARRPAPDRRVQPDQLAGRRDPRSVRQPDRAPGIAAWPLDHPVASSLAWCVALLAVAVPLTVRRFRAKTTD